MMMKNSEEYIRAKEKAIKYIGISKKTEYEVRKKLKGLGIASLVIDQILNELRELTYVNDKEYLRAYIKQNEKMMKYSIYELKQKLLQKGINKSIIEDRFDGLLHDNYETKIVEKLKDTKLKNYEPNKQNEYLYRRGFRLD